MRFLCVETEGGWWVEAERSYYFEHGHRCCHRYFLGRFCWQYLQVLALEVVEDASVF